MKTLAIFVADLDGWPESPSGVRFRDAPQLATTRCKQHSLCLLDRTPIES